MVGAAGAALLASHLGLLARPAHRGVGARPKAVMPRAVPKREPEPRAKPRRVDKDARKAAAREGGKGARRRGREPARSEASGAPATVSDTPVRSSRPAEAHHEPAAGDSRSGTRPPAQEVDERPPAIIPPSRLNEAARELEDQARDLGRTDVVDCVATYWAHGEDRQREILAACRRILRDGPSRRGRP